MDLCLKRLTREEKLTFIEKNDSKIVTARKVNISLKRKKVSERLKAAFEICNYVDSYHHTAMKETLVREINSELRRTLDFITLPIKHCLNELKREDLAILKSLYSLIDENYFTSLYEFSEIFDNLY